MTNAIDIRNPVTIVTEENREKALAGLPFFFKLVCNLVEKIHYGTITFCLPDGRALKLEGVEETSSNGIIVVRDFSFARRVILGGDIGFFESFAADHWDTPNLADCLYIFARNADYIRESFRAAPLIGWLDNIRRSFNRNTPKGSRRNIMAHYDLGNSFYEKWLDPTMTYSSARFSSPDTALSTAQLNKYRSLAQQIDLKPGDEVLEIGSGWGGFAEFAAKDMGAKVTGITISQAQYEYAKKRIFREGLNEQVEFRLQDYRDIDGAFDKVASIEMFEAVGKEYWTTYFSKVRDALKPGGIAGFQIITIADRFFERYSKSTDFIQRHIFPGGVLPSPSLLKNHIESAGLAWRKAITFGEDYALTLAQWHERFVSAWDDIKPMGFDERFKKLWRFYLAYCEAGFRAGTTDVFQIAAIRSE